MNPATIRKFKLCNNLAEIGDIPVEWDVVRLGDESITVIRGNKTINRFERVAFIPMDLVSDSDIFVRYEMRPKNDVKSFTYCERGDLLLAKITPSLENGKQGIVPDSIPNGFALATTEVFPISCKGIDKLFLFYILKFPKFRNKIISSMIGTTGRQRASKECVEKLRIPLPPLPEQRRIAEVLGTVDSAIQKVGGAVAGTERLKKGLMQRLLTKGIGHERFKETEVGRVPEEWEVVRLGDAIEELKNGFASGKRDENGTVQIRMNNVTTDGRLIFESYLKVPVPENINYWLLKKGDFLFNNTNSIDLVGKSTIFNDAPFQCTFSNHFTRLRFKKELVLSELILYHFLILWEMGYFKSVAIRHVGQSAVHTEYLLKLQIPLPPLPEQRRIAEILSAADRKLELERRRKEKLERVKKGLMNELLTGRKRVKI